MKTKAQIEIVGLVIIVLLISLGFLFVIKFVIMDTPNPGRLDPEQSQMPGNLLNALLQSTAKDCNNQQIRSLIRDCGMKQEILCGDKYSCKYINDTFNKALAKTLDVSNKKYYLKLSGGRIKNNFNGQNIVLGTICKAEWNNASYPIQAGVDTLIVELNVCT